MTTNKITFPFHGFTGKSSPFYNICARVASFHAEQEGVQDIDGFINEVLENIEENSFCFAIASDFATQMIEKPYHEYIARKLGFPVFLLNGEKLIGFDNDDMTLTIRTNGELEQSSSDILRLVAKQKTFFGDEQKNPLTIMKKLSEQYIIDELSNGNLVDLLYYCVGEGKMDTMIEPYLPKEQTA